MSVFPLENNKVINYRNQFKNKNNFTQILIDFIIGVKSYILKEICSNYNL